VQPNHGFILQLKLFERMGFKIDPTYKNYRIFRLKLAAEQVKSAKILPASFMNLLAADPGKMQEHPEPYVYRCRKCRRLLASKSNFITHKPKDVQHLQDHSHHSSPLARQRSTLETSEIETNPIDEIADGVLEATLNDKPQVCTKTFFVEPIAWMKDITYNVEGKLYCPSCKGKIGSFNWIMASKCPCGAQVSPSFYFIPSKVEYSNIVQNMKQVTV
jgi:dual specificity phosphatase 12